MHLLCQKIRLGGQGLILQLHLCLKHKLQLGNTLFLLMPFFFFCGELLFQPIAGLHLLLYRLPKSVAGFLSLLNTLLKLFHLSFSSHKRGIVFIGTAGNSSPCL